MKNILEEIIAYLQANVSLYSAVDIDNFNTDDTERLMIRQGTGQPKVTTYVDGSSCGRFNFSFFARSLDSGKANNMLWDIQDALDLTEFAITNALLVTIKPLSNPSLVSKTDNRESTYIISFEIDYYKE
jgi:hypothetical protein